MVSPWLGASPKPGVPVNERVEHKLPEVHPHLFDHLIGQAETGVVHGEENALDGQFGVESALHNFDRVEQLAQSFQGEVFALDGDDHTVRRRERIEVMSPREGVVGTDEDEVVTEWLGALRIRCSVPVP